MGVDDLVGSSIRILLSLSVSSCFLLCFVTLLIVELGGLRFLRLGCVLWSSELLLFCHIGDCVLLSDFSNMTSGCIMLYRLFLQPYDLNDWYSVR